MEFKLPSIFEGVRIFSSEKKDGSMDGGSIDQNLPKFLEKNSLSPTLAYSEQVHTKEIKLINKEGYYANCDGLLTGERVVLAVKSADCIPLLYFDKKRGMLGAFHVSRRSLLHGIIFSSLREQFEKNSLSPTEARFFLAPHIRAKNYAVKEDIINEIKGTKLEPFLNFLGQQTIFDLTKAVYAELEEIQVLRENVIDCGIDTYDDERFFSYRRGDKNLFISLIVLI